MKSSVALKITVLLTICTPSLVNAAAITYLGPTPYTSFDHPDSGSEISPFAGLSFNYFYLEDFEDGALNTPGVTLREFANTNLQTAFSDSVDGDDGVIDGFATGNTRSLYSNFATDTFTFDFSQSVLGTLPTHAGIVWTDVGRNFGGNPFPADLIDNTYFYAFDASGESLGRQGPFSLGDAVINRTTGEDRFLGVVHLPGISAIRISMPGKNNWEVDHLQYGSMTAVPEPGSILFVALSTLLLANKLRRCGRLCC